MEGEGINLAQDTGLVVCSWKHKSVSMFCKIYGNWLNEHLAASQETVTGGKQISKLRL